MKNLDIEAEKIIFVDDRAVIEKFYINNLNTDEILVKARYSLISIGTETTLLVKKRWNEPSVQIEKTAALEEEWGFDDYGKGEKWDMDKNRKCPGYALAGDVIEVGCNVTEFKPGDRVISLQSHASYTVCSPKPWHTLKIPNGVGYEESTLSVLASVAIHGIHRAKIQLGEDVVVMGAGLVGLLLVQFAKKNGAYPVISVDLSPRRLKVARKLGADYTINPTYEDLIQRVRQYTGSEGANCIIEAVGNPKVLQNCMQIAAPGGRVVVMGAIVGREPIDLYNEFVFRELTLIAAQQPRNPVQDSIYYHMTGQRNRQYVLGLLERKELNTTDLLTHRFHYSQAPEVYDMLGQAKNADIDGSGDINRDMIGVLLDWN